MNLADVTFVVLTRDEAKNVLAALRSIPSECGMLVVDAESRDATAALAVDSGARVVVRPWAGFVATRRFALGLVETPWTFMLDADEALDADAREALGTLEPAPDVDAYAVHRATYLCGRAIRFGPWGADAPVRLFRTACASLVARPAAGGAADLHEHWVVPGAIAVLGGSLTHDSYPDLATYRAKFSSYTTIEARGTQPSLGSFARAIVIALLRVPWYLVVKSGWRDGWRGAFVAIASACYPVAVAWKALRAR